MSYVGGRRYNTPLLLLWALFASLAVALSPAQVLIGDAQSNNNRRGAVASENKLCSQIGIDLLKAGGNAADALVGTVLCIGVTDCHHSGLGGGGFALIRSANGSYEAVDFRETAPGAAFEDMFKSNVLGSIIGGLASGVPGEAKGLYYIHKNYGILPWSTLFRPAIKLARDGFVVSKDFAKAMDLSTQFYADEFLSKDTAWADDFAPNGTRVGEGDFMTRERYARTLEAIAARGPDAFYKGPLAKATVRALRKANGTMTMEDMAKYKVVSRKPAEINYKGFRVHAVGAPSSGSVALSILKILEGYTDFDHSEHLSTHRMDEAIRFGYGKRASLGDPDHVDGVDAYEAGMLNQSYASSTRAKIRDKHTLNISDYDPDGFESHENHGTSHVVTADSSGMATSLTTTINLFFGSRVMVPETGMVMNNEMADFSVPNISNVFGYYPSPANYVRPTKRPLSSIAPTMAEFANGTLFAILGASGGSRIITTVVQNALSVLDRGMTIHEAVKQPRLHDQLLPNQVHFEYNYDNATVDYMRKRGHNVTWGPAGSSAQAIIIQAGVFEAAGEPRQHDSAGHTA
ncbi:hypothetical protein ABVK25_001314 [Lepraria finkii]|uniref:Glutathione hydrolase n=1 Tax=Lepraria finkii TaxID=1340010 RepID=A0ABR4BLB0_9LECA